MSTQLPVRRTVVEFHHPVLFWTGAAAIIAGVVAHLPMFAHRATEHQVMQASMADAMMLPGMAAILGGLLLATFGLVPASAFRFGRRDATVHHNIRLQALDDAPLTAAHWWLIAVLAVALIVDVMKPATLGFVVPRLAEEYRLTRSAVALLPLSALAGTVVGSIVWGVLGDAIGRRASILLAALLFIGTSICGAMPTFGLNLFMCFLMGASAGGLLPLAFTLLAELVPAKSRGWILVLVGEVGTTGGYMAASGSAAVLAPHYGWRALWLVGLPTGLGLLALSRYIPESPRFLLLRGRTAEANDVVERFGVTTVVEQEPPPQRTSGKRYSAGTVRLFEGPFATTTVALSICGLAWGLLNFGFLLWLPTNLHDRGWDVTATTAIMARASLYSLPGIVVVPWLYNRWSTKYSLVLFTVLSAASVLSVASLDDSLLKTGGILTALITLLLVSSGAVIAMLVPYAADVYPNHVRATATGAIAGASKLGGLIAQCLGLASLWPGLVGGSVIAAAPITLSALFLFRYGIETRGRSLEDIDLSAARRNSITSVADVDPV